MSPSTDDATGQSPCSFLAIGLEHKSAPVAIRERVALQGNAVVQTSATLIAHAAIDEVVILSTCNRTEIYLATGDVEAAVRVAGLHLTGDDIFEGAIQTWQHLDAINHLFRVAAGLESQVLGERQIVGQVHDALETAEQARTLGPNLQSLFRSAIGCAHRAHARAARSEVIALHDVDGLPPAGMLEQRSTDVHVMEEIIAQEVKEFSAWYLAQRVAPMIARLRSRLAAVSEKEIERIGPRLVELTDGERAAVESLTGRMIDRIFHHLVMRLQLAAQTDPTLVNAGEFFFLHDAGDRFKRASEPLAGTRTTDGGLR